MNWLWIALLCYAYLLGMVIVCMWFSELAERKGYSATLFLWICLIFGVSGYCLVALLPDKTTRYQLEQIRNDIDALILSGE